MNSRLCTWHLFALIIVIGICRANSFKHGGGNGNDAAGHGDTAFEESGGSENGADHHESGSDEGKKGFSSDHHFDKGEKGSSGKEEESGFFEEEGGHKKSHFDEGDEYGSTHESKKGSKGGKSGGKKGHKKGSKTTGFHHKSSKDDYHKEHKVSEKTIKSFLFKLIGDKRLSNKIRFHSLSVLRR